MKTFKDLEFKPHPVMPGLMARMSFKNGFGVSVVRFTTFGGGYGSYTSNESEWELAVLHNNDITYDTSITNDVLGHLSARKVTEVMKRVQRLRKRK